MSNTPIKKQSIYIRISHWVGAILILGYLFWRIDLPQFYISIQQSNLSLYIPLMILFIVIWFLIESQNLTAVFNHFEHKIPYIDVLYIRGITYLLMIINYNLGVAGIVLYLNQAKGITLMRASSIMLFYMYMETTSLSLMVLLGCLFTSESSAIIDKILFLSAAILIGVHCGILIYRNLPDKKIFQKIKNLTLLQPFKETGIKSYLILISYRGTYFSTFILFFYLALKTFHIDIPFLTLAAFVPLAFFIGNLPITPFGLGTIQAAMLFFFKDYSTEANILAFSITYSITLLLFRAPIGLYYIKKRGIKGIREITKNI